jgi:hypothetical protein
MPPSALLRSTRGAVGASLLGQDAARLSHEGVIAYRNFVPRIQMIFFVECILTPFFGDI